jgi:hypothetical protein
VQIIDSQDFDQQNQSRMDDQLLVRFFVKPMQDQAASQKAGRPVYADREYIEIRTPGSRDAICRPASAGDIARFQRHYDAYKARNDTEMVEGTPLAEWPLISRSQAEELSFFNVKTVEQLVAMSDQNAAQFMGIQALKTKAKAWLKQAKEAQAAEELQAELKKRDDEIAELKAAVKALQSKPKRRVTKKKTGRRKKATAKQE